MSHGRRGRRSSVVRAVVAIAAGAIAGLALGLYLTPPLRPPPSPVARAIAAAPETYGDADLAAFYRNRGDAPLWSNGHALLPQAWNLVQILRRAGADGLDPAAYGADQLEMALKGATGGAPGALARADILLSRAFAAYVGDLRRAPSASRWAFVDPGVLLPPTRTLPILEIAAHARSLNEALVDARQANPIYLQLRNAYAAQPPGPLRDLIVLNLARARLLPADPGPRYIVVDPAAQALWLFEKGRPTFQMKVIVGKPSEPTPNLAGLIRYAMLRPYWNVPPDLVRDRVAPHVLSDGPAWLATQHFEVLSDWSASARPIEPEAVDWSAVAAGRRSLRVRQLPGPDNMMGKIKLMLPNPLGVYLHDTPDKALFGLDRRTESSGCVRLADAEALATRLFGRRLEAGPATPPEQQVDLAAPVPVFIVYLTAIPEDGRVVVLPDVYGRDPSTYRSSSQANAPAPARAQ